MRALVCNQYGSPNSLVLEEREEPVAGENQILVTVKAAAINFPDVLTIAGKYQVKTPPPFVPGFEAAGVVEAIGPGANRFSVGDSVMVNTSTGGFAEKCLVDESRARPLLPGLDFAQGAAFNIAYCTTMHAFRQCTQLEAGETLLVLGSAGGVGIAAVEIGKALGARVIAAASSAEKLEFARSAGADELINYSDTPIRDALKQMTDGKGVDVIYDPVGGEQAELAMRSLAWRGRHLVVGFASGDFPNFPANIMLLKETQVIGVYWGGWIPRQPELQAANVTELATLIKEGKLNLRVTEQYALDDFAAAFAAITERRAMGKVVLTM